MHGFEITSWLEDNSGGTLDVDDSALYHALHRMEERGLIAAEWGVTENNRRARYYGVTSAGRAHLRAETARWLRYSELVSGIPPGRASHGARPRTLIAPPAPDAADSRPPILPTR